MNLALFIIFYLSLTTFVVKRSLRLMHLFQQEEYDNGRFFRFLFKRRLHLIDKKVTFIIILLLPLAFALDRVGIQLLFISTILLVFTIKEPNPLYEAKKKLALTTRVQRILVVAYLLMIGAGVGITLISTEVISYYILTIALIQLVPFLLIVSNILLSPVESVIKNKYRREAEEKFNELKPTVIGITGSYGKTSVKHILQHILNTAESSLATPGSVNTLMGITRVIREQLTEEHKYFIVEMGAYGIGSIARLCEFTPPDHAILTAVGDAHYERFKSLDNVAQAKFELFQAAIVQQNETGETAKLVVNGNLVKPGFIEDHAASFKEQIDVTAYSESPVPNDTAVHTISDVKQSPKGIEFKITVDEETYEISAPIYGSHQADNIAVCFVMALRLGIPVETIKSSLKTLPQIRHRLEVIQQKGAPTIIDDTYNANPVGFISAMTLMSVFKKEKIRNNQPHARSIVVTPGLVELGSAHQGTHFDLGLRMGMIADVLVAIKPKRIKTLIRGFERSGGAKPIHTFDSFVKAKKWIDENAVESDIILYANDLPDLYEASYSL